MPSGIEVQERFGSRASSGGNVEYLYWTLGSDDTNDISDAVLDVAPSFHVLSSGAALKQQGITAIDQQGNELWFVTVSYSNGDNSVESKEPGVAVQEFQFDTTGDTQHITQNIFDTSSGGLGTGIYPSDAPIFDGAIGVSSDGEIAGVDIGVKSFKFSISRDIPISDLTTAYVGILRDRTFCYNDDTITVTVLPGVTMTFAEGELLFKGCRGSGSVASGRVGLTFDFEASPNKSDFTIGDISVGSKLGWEYLWVYYGPEIDESSGGTKFRVMKPKAVYVEPVYEAADLSDLEVD